MRGERGFHRAVAAALGTIVLVLPTVVSAAPRVALIRSSAIAPFVQAADALVAALRPDPSQPEVLTFDLDGDAANAADVLRRARAARPTAFVTVGSLATSAVLDASGNEPLVFSMVLYPRQSGFVSRNGHEVTGASLDIPPELQFRLLRRLVPRARRIGVLHAPEETGAVVATAAGAAAALGMTLVARPVAGPAEAVSALTALMEQVDVIWAVADSHVFTPQTTSPLVLAALRRRMPLIGLSNAQVRTGALAAFTCDYADIGRQTAELTLAVLHGAHARDLPVTVPRSVSLALNLRTAEHLGLEIAADVTAEAGEVVR